MWTKTVLLLATYLGSAAVGHAQLPVVLRTAADSALYAGDLERADSLYYYAVRLRSRDPEAREALGRYLGMRGASRIAAVLLEEARLFGADPARIGIELAPLYESFGDWRALLTMPSSPFSSSEKRRAVWFTEHPPSNKTDTTSQTIVGGPKGDTLGRVAVHVGGRTALAVILVRDVGVTVGMRMAEGTSHAFSGGDSTVIVLENLTAGGSRWTNVAARVGDAPGAVTVGLATLGPVTPTFDFAKNRITYNRPILGAPLARLPLFRNQGDLFVLDRGHWMPLAEFVAMIAKARQSVTIDYRVGEVRVQP